MDCLWLRFKSVCVCVFVEEGSKAAIEPNLTECNRVVIKMVPLRHTKRREKHLTSGVQGAVAVTSRRRQHDGRCVAGGVWVKIETVEIEGRAKRRRRSGTTKRPIGRRWCLDAKRARDARLADWWNPATARPMRKSRSRMMVVVFSFFGGGRRTARPAVRSRLAAVGTRRPRRRR